MARFTIIVLEYEDEFFIYHGKKSFILKRIEDEDFYDYLLQACEESNISLKSVEKLLETLQNPVSVRELESRGFRFHIKKDCFIH